MTSTASAPASRSRTLDVLRGLTILVMVFVNDVAGVRDTPPFMKHVSPPDADGMTFVDVVFPAFLFIVGLSIPLALGKRIERGERAAAWRHVLLRTAGLLLIGLFMVNEESISPAGPLPPALWSLLVYASVFLLFGAVPRAAGARPPLRWTRALGAVLLVAAALLYRGPGPPGLVELRPQWWGILGLIGWAYLVGSATYLVFGRSLAAVVGAIPLLYALYVADAAGAFASWTWLHGFLHPGSMLGSHAAITVSGVAMGLAVGPRSPLATHGARLKWAAGYALALGAAACLLHAAHAVHPMFIYNKIKATPPWCLSSSAFTVAGWAALYSLIDLRGRARGVALLEGAGQNALTAYLIPYVLDALLRLVFGGTGIPNPYALLGESFATGFLRAILLAIAVAWIAGRLRGTRLALAL